MSLKVEGESCPVCHAYLFDEDDIVYCPVCGAPHHRDCYNAIGHCALEADHGTEREYSREKQKKLFEEKQQSQAESGKAAEEKNESPYAENKIICPYCREMYSAKEPRCPKCGNTNLGAGRGFAMPDPLGGTPADMDLGEGVTAKQAAGFVLSNSQRYIPKFARIKMGNKVSFNWGAFLFPEGWFLYRKMYKAGIVALLLTVIFSLCSMPFTEEIRLALSGMEFGSIFEQYSYLAKQVTAFSSGAAILAGVSGVCSIVFHIICGLFGDAFYAGHAVKSIKEINEEGTDRGEELRKRGNINPLLFFVGLMTSSYLPSILYWFATSIF